MIARWGYSPNILAFELWNEVDVPADWAREMFSYIKSINPHEQLMTISLDKPWTKKRAKSSDIWKLEDFSIIQRHTYGDRSRDVTGYMLSTNKDLAAKYNKPLLFGEFGMDSSKNDKKTDIAGTGTALHNSIWASTFSGSFSGALNWWWAGYVKGKNLYYHYAALRKFVEDINWDSPNISFANTSPVTHETPKTRKDSYSNTVIHPAKTWGDTRYNSFRILNNGDIEGGMINYYLHGTTKIKMRIKPEIHAEWPTDGKLKIHVDAVSQGANLAVYLDGKEVASKKFLTGRGTGPWISSKYLKDYDIYQCTYDTIVEVDVPQGSHTIKLANTGRDWLGIKEITLTNHESTEYAKARVAGMIIDDQIIFWIQNKEFNWRSIAGGKEPSTISGASFTVYDVDNGSYTIEWWDTFTGKIISRNTLTARNNTINILIPDFSKDLACKIKKS